jgi:hypothetical protein
MKNTGITLTISIAILAVVIGGLLLWQKGIKPQNKTSTTNTPTQSAPDTKTTNDIDSELKNLDLEMNSAFQKDSDTDPTMGI